MNLVALLDSILHQDRKIVTARDSIVADANSFDHALLPGHGPTSVVKFAAKTVPCHARWVRAGRQAPVWGVVVAGAAALVYNWPKRTGVTLRIREGKE